MKNELKILASDDNVYSVDEYLALPGGLAYAIGIVFESPVIGRRVLAIQSWKEKWGHKETVYTEARSESAAVQLMSGLEDTKRIVGAQANIDCMTAAKRCWEYKVGGLQWYLPSLMELGVIYTFRNEINEVMIRIGCNVGYLLPTEGSDEIWVWSSSELCQFSSWSVIFSRGNFYDNGKVNTLVVRAVAMLPENNNTNLSTLREKGLEVIPTLETIPSAELATELRNRGFKGELTKGTKLIV